MAKTSPAQFVRQVRQEINRIVWPSKRETGLSTVMVLVMVMLMSIFFLIIDQILAWGVQFLIGL